MLLTPWAVTKLDDPATGLYNEAIGEGETGPATSGSRRPSMTTTYNKEARPTDAQDDPEAREQLRRAFEKTARWPTDFNGFSADLTVNVDGKEFTGMVTVQPAQDVTVSLPDAEVQKWATGTISMIAVHRAHRTFDQSDGKSVLTLDRSAAHPLGQTIRVEDSVITADKKYLTTRYTVYYFNPQDGRLVNVESFTDTHVRVGHADLPASRRIISAENGVVSVRTLTFANHRLL